MIIKAIISFIAAIVINVLIDGRKWDKQKNKEKNTRNHSKGWWLKAGLCLPAVYFFMQASNFRLIPNIAVTAGLMICWFMFLFDGGYNIYRGEPLFFRGTEDGKEDAKTDNFWQSMPQALHITLKLVLAFGTAYLYKVGLQK